MYRIAAAEIPGIAAAEIPGICVSMDRSPDTDSLCHQLGACSLTGQEHSRFQSELSDFPHTFQLQDLQQLPIPQLKRLKSGLESALLVGYETNVETARARNLLTYILHRLDQSRAALQQLDKVLQMEDQRHNLVTLANKAVILHSLQQPSSAKEHVQTLLTIRQEDKDFGYLVVRAKAELAFTYTRLGPSFSQRAVDLFKEVLQKARDSDKWLWSFGLALTRRRALRCLPQASTPMPSKEAVAEQRDLLQLMMHIAQHCPSQNLKAKTHAEIALLLFNVSKTPLRKELYSKARSNPEQACETALQLDDKDNSVLCKCGRIFRYIRQIEKSCQLLERAASIRPSSTAYHHLGITYKAMATKEKYKDVNVPAYSRQRTLPTHPRQHNVPTHSRQFSTQVSRPRSAGSYNSLSRQFGQMSVGRSRYDSGSSHYSPNAGVPGATAGSTLSQDRDVRCMQRMIKSPPNNVTRFSRADRYVSEAMCNFKKAVDFSEGENTRALYDLALLQKSLGEFEEAKDSLQEMLKHYERMHASDEINIYEQLGLIMKEMADAEKDEAKKKHIEQDSSSMLMLALKTASRVYAQSPEVKERMGEVFQSFSILLKEVEASDQSTDRKLREKAELYRLIRNHQHSLELLQEIGQMNPQEANEAEYLKLCIENYVQIGDYMKASDSLGLLELTSHSAATKQLFGDEKFVPKIYLRAAHQALQRGSSVASQLFRAAFQEAMKAFPEETSSSEYVDTDASEDGKNEADRWDVGIVHDQSTRRDAITLAEVLNHMCGLKVPIMDRDAPANGLDLEGELQIIKNSKLVVVLAGGKISRRVRLFIQHVAKRPSTVTLLVEGHQVPTLLQAHRSLLCPEDMLAAVRQAADGEGQTTQSQMDNVCKIFGFFLNVNVMADHDTT